ncbi:heme peroxidase [Polychytrium aggregatum]|uniref:heme peroxidase n=1 Tax=Polychytrium aggregatum TaxID=110093 RepID=UPI0022FE64EB|nr:heme peroxidase [Polychytrium aggregatum]KAI9207359.1 heme peroxidase [Polychytrium aggregatum]
MSQDYEAVAETLRKFIATKRPEWDDGSIGPVLVRLAWHASGTYDKHSRTGGSNGATMRFKPEATDPANAGLEHARAFLESVKEQFPWISTADLWTLAGVTAIEVMGGPKIPWKPGRLDKNERSVTKTEIPPNGRLPDASQGSQHIRDVFNRMGFNDQEIVALSGAHALGRCHTDRSGYKGPWTFNPTRFSNQYFVLLKNVKWTKKQWDGPEQYQDPHDELMMLPTDMALLWDPEFKKYVELYAQDKEAFFRDFSAAFARLLELGVNRAPPPRL